MRIGIEAQRIFRREKHGMDIYAKEIIQALARQNPSDTFIIFVRKDIYRDIQLFPNMQIIEIDALTYVDFEQIWLPMAIRRTNIDIMHYTSNTASLFCPVPYVVTVHDIMYLKGNTGGTFYQKLGHYYRKWIVPKSINYAKCLITVSEYEKKSMLHVLPLLPNFIHVVYNGVAELFCPNPEKELHPFNIFHVLPDKFILFLGNQAPKKNMKRVLKAYALYSKKTSQFLPLVLVETSDEQLTQTLRELNLEFIRPSIFLTGYLTQVKLAKLYQLATLFVYPSLQESFGIPLIESMASGTPVITSDTTALPEIAGGAAWLIDPTDTEQLADVMNLLLSNRTNYEQLQKKGLQRAKKFTWDEAAKNTYQIYLTVNQ